jgi:RHS repeat-associated protein
LGNHTVFTYDARDNLTHVTDPRGVVIETNAYDLRNRLVSRTDALGLTETFGYDPAGNRTARTDKKGQVTHYAYDALNRIARITYADGRTADYTYDLAGNLVRISDSVSGECLFTYDALNRLTSETSDRGVVAYRYDAIGRVIERTINGGDPTTYAYDRADRITTITFRNQSVTYTYDLAGRLIERTLPNGINQVFAYNDANELLSITYKTPTGAVIDALTYTYDANGNPIARTRQGLGSVPETPFTATYDANNRMLTYNGQPLTYDANGNLVSRETPQGLITYTWDAQDRLIGITGPNGTATFAYDYAGRRIEKTINGTTTAFLYDGAQAIAELQGSAIGTTYLTGLQIDEVLARYSNQGNRTLLTDALGSVLAQTDDTQTSTSLYAYSPYGEVTQVGENDNPLQYTGRENDDTGLYFYRARYYDPALKRFLTSDPIGLKGGTNLYAYVGGSPLRFADPSGLIMICAQARSGTTTTLYCYDSRTGEYPTYDLTENASKDPTAPYEENQQLAPGSYKLLPRPGSGKVLPQGSPVYTTPGQSPGTIITPSGKKRGDPPAGPHIGTQSAGCPLFSPTEKGKRQKNDFYLRFKENVNIGGSWVEIFEY